MSRLVLTSTAASITVPGRALEECGLELPVLFGFKLVAWRSVESVIDGAVELLLHEDSVWVWSQLVPPDLRVGQWLRFERRGYNVLVSLDLRATMRGEAKLTGLFERLTAQTGSAAT